uniref:Uncharacterized protein n=1 Tax=Anguilla anguilla TaxID=7936 RepID=A0A0E9R553_ANGAN
MPRKCHVSISVTACESSPLHNCVTSPLGDKSAVTEVCCKMKEKNG